MITHYLKVAVRNLLKYKTQNLISIGGLAIGLFCFCICFYISRFVGSVDKCFENHKRIADIYVVDEKGEAWSGVSGKMLPHLQQRTWDGVEGFTLLSFAEKGEYTLIGEDDKLLPYELAAMETDSLYYKIFTPTIIAGSWEQVAHNRNSIVLTRHTAKRMFGNIHNAIGEQLTSPNPFVSGTTTYTIRAVIEDLPENTSMNFMHTVDLLKVNDDGGYETLPTPDITGYYLYALLSRNYSAQQLNEAFHQAQYTFRMFGGDDQICAKPLGENHSQSIVANMMALITAIVGFLVLLAASLNFFHFQTGSFLNRGREFSIRKILGNTTSGLFWMQFVQITIVILVATLLSGCLIELTSPFLSISLFRFSIQMTKEDLIPHLMQYMGGLLVLTALVAFGIALYIRRATMRVSLHGLGNVNGKKPLRNTLLGIQFFICWLFVSMSAALYLQSEKTSSALFDTLTRQEKEDIISVPLDYKFLKSEDREVIINHIRQHAGIKDILFSDNQLVNATMTSMYDTLNAEHSRGVRISRVTANFAKFLNVGLEGQVQRNDKEIVIDRKLANQLGGDVIGKSLYDYKKDAFTITGIMDNINNYVYADGYGKADYGQVYFLINEAESDTNAFVKCHPGKTEEVRAWIEQKLRETLPSSVEPKISTLMKDIEYYQSLENNLKGIILFFSIVCLIITLLGVYSAITLDTERRQKEVAIRKVNGAGLKEIIALFARLYLWMLGISAIFAFPIVFAILQMWKQMYLVFFSDGILYWGGILLGVTGITALTVIFRILKIARINPAKIIKSE
jgi:ABC-type lipoprotein release transport system permease subunit